MVKLRRITLPKDYETSATKQAALKYDFRLFKTLYINHSLQWLYKANEIAISNQTTENSSLIEREFYPEKIQAIQEEYENYSYEDFLRDVKNQRLYWLEEYNQIIGYIFILKYGRYNRIAEWAMFEVNDQNAKKVFQELMKIKKSIFWEVLPTNKQARNFFKSCGFEECEGGILRKNSS